MSFYIVNDDKFFDRAHSVIKFGSMDREGLEDERGSNNLKKKLWQIRTINKTTWDLNLESMKLGSGNARENLADDARLRFEPQLPYIYLPTEIFKKFAAVVNAEFALPHIEPICGLLQNACVFKSPCNMVRWDLYISFRVNDGVNLAHSFILPAERMLVDAKLMGDDRDYCYVPVFDHGL